MLCRALDGLQWELADKDGIHRPIGHDKEFPGTSPHWNCRSLALPVCKSWEELAKDAGGDTSLAKKLDGLQDESRARASIDGQVSGGMTYEDWLRGQGKERQLEILGPKRFELWEQGVPLYGMTDFSNSAISVEELRAKLDIASYRDWANGVLGDQWHARNETKLLGFFPDDVLEAIKQKDIIAANSGIELIDRNILHMMRDSKADRGAGISTHDLLRIPEILKTPQAILLDKRDGTLLYVFAPQDSPKQGKLAIKTGITAKIYSNGKSIKRSMNQIVTAGLVDITALTDTNSYEVLKGKL